MLFVPVISHYYFYIGINNFNIKFNEEKKCKFKMQTNNEVLYIFKKYYNI